MPSLFLSSAVPALEGGGEKKKPHVRTEHGPHCLLSNQFKDDSQIVNSASCGTSMEGVHISNLSLNPKFNSVPKPSSFCHMRRSGFEIRSEAAPTNRGRRENCYEWQTRATAEEISAAACFISEQTKKCTTGRFIEDPRGKSFGGHHDVVPCYKMCNKTLLSQLAVTD